MLKEKDMNRVNRFKILGFVVLFTSLTGCTTYVEQGPPRTVYVPPPPVIVEPPRVVVAPPPAYIPPPPQMDVVASIEIHAETDFYEPLNPYGHWEIIPPHGRCWVPAGV